MAHYDNIASRVIDYSNRNLFQGFLEFFIYFEQTRAGYWSFHRPTAQGVTSFPLIAPTFIPWWNIRANVWRAVACCHWIAAFLLRLVLLPLTSAIYTVSRIGLILLNPFTAWKNNPRKTIYMLFAACVPGLIILNNIYSVVPSLVFNMFLTSAHSLVAGVILSMGMAMLFHGAKVLAQRHNAVELKDPPQANVYHPKNIVMTPEGKKINVENVYAVPDSVNITAPKHRPITLLSGSTASPALQNKYNEINSESDDLRYAYYKLRENRPIIWSTPPRPIKKLLNAYDAAFAAHGHKNFPQKAKLLADHASVVYSTSFIGGESGQAVRKNYRISSAVALYDVDKSSNTFMRKAGK
jgi:hypothetical protein